MSEHLMNHLRVVQEPNRNWKAPATGRTNPAKLYQVFKQYFLNQVQETVIAVALNPGWEIIGYSEIARGKVNSVALPVSSICQFALIANATDIVIMHGHQSNQPPDASGADIASTLQIESALKLLEIRLLDHIVVGNNGYFSFRTKGLLQR